MRKRITSRLIILSIAFSAVSCAATSVIIYLCGEPHTFDNAIPFIVAAFFILALLGTAISLLVSHKIMRPLTGAYQYNSKTYPELASLMDELVYQREENARRLEELEKKSVEMAELQNIRQEFTANVSHELKTPLTSISGYAEMIATGMAQEDDIPLFAERIHKESKRLLSLIGDIIKLSQLDAPYQNMENEECDLYEIALECSDILTVAAEAGNITVSVEGVHSCIIGDRYLINEMIYNLIDNAIRYNREGGSVFVTACERSITVRDTGIGIPKEHQNRVFERFYRVDKSRSKITGGTGLGLAIVKHIAEIHGASISLKSDVGSGTEISVIFQRR